MGWIQPTAAVSAALVLCANTYSPLLDSPPDQAESFSLAEAENLRMTVPVTIGDKGPFRFMVDTGSQATVLSRELADRLDLPDRRTATLVGMASRQTIETAAVAGVTLGRRTFDVAKAPLLDGSHLAGADGILGLDSLKDQRVLLDFDTRTLTVSDKGQGVSDRYDIVVNARSSQGQLVIKRAVLDGVSVSIIIDTGAEGSVGNAALAARLRGAEVVGSSRLTDVNGEVLGGTVKFGGRLTVGQASLRHFPIAFVEAPTFAALGLTNEPALVLGMAELRMFRRVAIDFKERRVLFDLPRTAQMEERAPRAL